MKKKRNWNANLTSRKNNTRLFYFYHKCKQFKTCSRRDNDFLVYFLWFHSKFCNNAGDRNSRFAHTEIRADEIKLTIMAPLNVVWFLVSSPANKQTNTRIQMMNGYLRLARKRCVVWCFVLGSCFMDKTRNVNNQPNCAMHCTHIQSTTHNSTSRFLCRAVYRIRLAYSTLRKILLYFVLVLIIV